MKHCAHCKRVIVPDAKHPYQKFCSLRCRVAAHRRKHGPALKKLLTVLALLLLAACSQPPPSYSIYMEQYYHPLAQPVREYRARELAMEHDAAVDRVAQLCAKNTPGYCDLYQYHLAHPKTWRDYEAQTEWGNEGY